jgi:hypothetical protein
MADAPVSMFAKQEFSHFLRMKSRAAHRDRVHQVIHQVREGNIKQLFPEELEFDVNFNGSPTANFIDVVARDLAEGIGPLPSLACVSGKMQTDADKQRAERKNHIGQNYWRKSLLEINMISAADQYVSYGYGVILIEPDVERQMPYMCVLDPKKCYYEKDRYGSVKHFAQAMKKSIDELIAEFPEYRLQLLTDPTDDRKQVESTQTELEVIRWVDDQKVMLMLPGRNNLVLGSYLHRMSRTPVIVAERPGDGTVRGQFDDIVWVQVARAILATLSLSAANTAVNAPIAVPSDMDELPIGPHAILTSDNAKDIHRLNLELPNSIFASEQVLDNELKVGARYPDARTGGIQGASVITGKGVEALLGTFDAQIKGAQLVWKYALESATALCFEMDEVWWPDVTKTVNGTLSGQSYEFTYQPSKDIAGRYACTVTYGFAAGMQPAQSYITLLQLEGAGLVAKGTAMQNTPFGIDPVREQRQIDIEGWREALKQGVFAYMQASGQIAVQGGDPSDLFNLAVDVIRRLQDGQSVEDSLSEAYATQQQAKQAKAQADAQAQQEAAQAAGGAPGGPAGPGGQESINGASGLPPGVAPGQAGMPPGGMPTIERMISGFRGNASTPVNEATIQRRVPTGT